jgi:tetratricopeptide (TPR) repeat protein
MKSIVAVCLMVLGFAACSYAQDYTFYTRQADSLYNRGHYQKAADTYKQAVSAHSEYTDSEKDPFFWNIFEGIMNCYNNMLMTDSVYKYLEEAILNGNTSYQIFTNTRLSSQYADPRMQKLMTLSDSLYVLNNPQADHEVGLVLRHMLISDYKIRQEMKLMEMRKAEKKKMDSIYAEAMIIDSMNMIKLIPIFEKYGYPGMSVVGNDYTAITTPLLILQHADIKFQKKYYNLIKKAAEAGDIPMFSYAFITDQILVSKGKKQLYGTQYRYDDQGRATQYPIKNPKQLHKRLADAGLE